MTMTTLGSDQSGDVSGTPSRRLDGPTRQVKRNIFPVPAPVLEAPPAKPIEAPFAYKKPKPPRRWKRAIIVTILALVLGVGGYFGMKLFLAARSIISRNTTGGAPALAGTVDPTKLKGEGDGRINILLLGIGGPGHDGPFLSDTIIVASIDPTTKEIAMLSLPRDMWIPIPGYGSSKINSACAYGESENYPGGCGALAKLAISKLLDLPIHYYIRADFDAFKQAVDSVGGINLTVAHALYDPEYPCDKNQGLACGYSQKAGATHMNGITALKYARCRKGNCDNDFGRAGRQQQVLLALRQQALSLDTLTNPAKISGLIDSVGDHVKTDMQLFEIERLAKIVKDIDASKVISKVLDTSPDGLLVDYSADSRGYIELPKSGNFSDIQEFAHSIFVDSYLKNEAANIDVQNGTQKNGLATTVGKMLKAYGYNITSMTTAADQNTATTVLYDYTGGKKPYTIKYLESRLNVKVKTATPVSGDPDIRIILGNDYKLPSTTN